VYRLWTGVQVVVFWSIVPALVAAIVVWDWRYLLLALGLAIAHWGIGGVGAGCLWEMSNLAAFVEGTRGETLSFPLSAVKDVRIGRGWARKGLWLVIPPFVPPVNQWAEGYCVSFEGPNGEGVCAFHMRTQEDARALAALLQRSNR
jgi:hypothetical protein